MYTKTILSFLLVILISSGCATYKLHNNPIKDIELKVIPTEVKKLSRLFLIGDTGSINDESKSSFSLLRKKLSEEDIPTKVILLGDNIYPSGMPTKDSLRRIEAEAILDFQVDHLDDFDDDIIFIPGNHDWARWGKDGLNYIIRQDEYIKENYRENVRLLPNGGCPGPEIIELSEGYVLIIIDSQWWLQDWDIVDRINEDCESVTRPDFIAQFKDAIKDNSEKQIIVALHHPLYSNGSHGGYYSFEEHLFPLGVLSHKFRRVPLPIIGSIYPLLRGTFGNVQDIPHHKYQDLKSSLLGAIDQLDVKNVVFASGHEHSLQYQAHRGHHFIVSGSGAKLSPLTNTKELIFGHGETGFFTLDLYEEGYMHLQAWESGGDSEKMVFEHVFQHPREKSEPIFSEYDKALLAKEKTTAIVSDDFQKSNFYTFMFGEHYRKLYNLPIEARIMNLEKERGGLEVVQRGGGMQTSSLRLEAKDEQQYVLRSIKKDASSLIPDIFQGTFALEILQDQLTASHPYAAFVIPPLAEAIGIYHTNPEVVYLPEQPRLGVYNKDFADNLFLYEERPDDDGRGIKGFGGSKKIISTTDAVEEMRNNHDHFIDYEFAVKSRLFDMFLGDWDRHDDQWRWATFKDDKKTILRPIPRDRDQAFSDYDGFVSSLAYSYLPTFKKFGPFKKDISRLNWFNYNGRNFDRFFLNQADLNVWLDQAKFIEENLTDEVIENAISLWPKAVQDIYGEEVLEILKARRNKITEWAGKYYRFIAKEVTVYGTDDDDLFEIERKADGSTQIQIFEWRDGKKRNEQYQRTFLPNETKRIYIYGLNDDDQFEIQGDEKNGIPIIIIGGDGHDLYTDKSKSRNGIKIFDEHNKDHKRNDFSSGLKYKEVKENEIEFNRSSYQYDMGIPLLVAGFNPDEGIILGGGYQWTKQKFLKDPFGSQHAIKGSYSFGTGGFQLSYLGEFAEAIGKTDIVLNAIYEGPSYVQNYFGIGNETKRVEEELDFYRVIHTRYGFYPSLRKRFPRKRGSISLNPFIERVSLEETDGRFIDVISETLDPAIFDGKNFTGVSAKFNYVMKDHPSFTRRGMDFQAEYGIRSEINSANDIQTFFNTSLSFYYQLNKLGKPVIASRIGFSSNQGDFDFYNGATLGGKTNFRGLANQRLVGNKSFYQNIDIRYKIASYKSYLLPAAMGITLSFDHGRVWAVNEDSDLWHYSYGGGVWLSPFNELVLSLNYNVSDLNDRFTVLLGFFF